MRALCGLGLACLLLVRLLPVGVAWCMAATCPDEGGVVATASCCCEPPPAPTPADDDCCLSLDIEQPDADPPLPTPATLAVVPTGLRLAWLEPVAADAGQPLLLPGARDPPHPARDQTCIRLLL